MPSSGPEHAPDFDSIARVFGLIEREVWIVTASDGAQSGGLVATWVFQASLAPERPVVAAAIAPIHNTADIIRASGALALHLISPAHIELAWRFGLSSGRDQDKLAGLDFATGRTGAPILTDASAWLDCRVFTTTDIGDRILFWADVVDGQAIVDEPVLTESALFAAASIQQRTVLKENLQRDLELLQPLHQSWRDTLKAI